MLKLLADGLGVREPGRRPGPPQEVKLTPPRLTPETLSALCAVVGSEHAWDDHETRLRHALGRSTPDLLRLRSTEPLSAPDVVLAPGDHAEVQRLLELATERRVAVVPFGGGTSVVGGLEPGGSRFSGSIALDLGRMDGLVALDEESRLAVLGPGLRGPEAEELLGARGYTLGHFPQSFQYATLGGFAAARSSGQASAGYGRFDERVLGLRVATPSGTLRLGRAPRSAAGPDLRQLLLGSEGALGVITELTVSVSPLPEQRIYDGWRLSSFATGVDLLRRLAQDGPVPTVARLSDEAETALNLARPEQLGGGEGGGCLAIIGHEGTEEEVARRRAATEPIIRSAGGELDAPAGEAWERERFQGPYLRDALLDAGALVETLETATFWSSLGEVYAAVSTALRDSLSAQGTPPVILCHVSHIYPAGASLYYTVGCAAAADPLGQWRMAKEAASEAILARGATISHHHGVGRDHLGPYRREVGPLAIAALRAVKAKLDPAGILNPGVLIPEDDLA